MVAPHLGDGELIGRLALSIALCGAIGAEREARGQIAGLRTHILVGLGSTLFTLVSAYGFSDWVAADGASASVDPSRIAAQIVTGIGFLGAGAIIKQGLSVRGLTTAAALWIVAAIGMAVGAGYYLGAIASTAGVLIALVGFRKLRPWMMAGLQTHVAFIRVEAGPGLRLEALLERLRGTGITLESMDSSHEPERRRYRLEVRAPARLDLEEVATEIREVEGVSAVAVEGHRAE